MLGAPARVASRAAAAAQFSRPPWSLALPAESSQQALRRAISQQLQQASSPTSSQRRHHSRQAEGHGKGYATAAAIAVQEQTAADDDWVRPSWRHHAVDRRPADSTFEPRPPDRTVSSPPPHFPSFAESAADVTPSTTSGTMVVTRTATASSVQLVDDDISPVERFRAKIVSRPLAAVTVFGRLSSVNISQLSWTDLDHLFKSLLRPSRPLIRPSGADFDNELVTGFRRILAAMRRDRLSDSGELTTRGLWKARKITWTRWLRSLVVMRVKELDEMACRVYEIRMRRARLKTRTKESLGWQLPKFVDTCVRARRWDIIDRLIVPPNTLQEEFTQECVEARMAAHLSTGQPQLAIEDFEFGTSISLEPSSRSRVYLLSAQLRIGNLEAARSTLRTIKADGRLDEGSQQLAILHGYKELGMDRDLEERVLSDIERLGLAPESAFLNLLISSRLHRNDLQGVFSLLELFDLACPLANPFVPRKSALKAGMAKWRQLLVASERTYLLAFRAYSRCASLSELRDLWVWVASKSQGIDASYVCALISRLGHLGEVGIAENLIRSCLPISDRLFRPPADVQFRLPGGFRPDITVLNALLPVLAETEGIDGLGRVGDMMRACQTQPDAHTLTLILQHARRSFRESPVQLTDFFRRLLQQAPHLQATIKQADLLMLESLSTAGAAGTQAFHRAMRPILQSLNSRGVTPSSGELGNRLRTDILSLAKMSNEIPPIRNVWSVLVGKGYKPTRAHFSALIKAYSTAGALDQAMETYTLAAQSDIATDGWLLLPILEGHRAERDTRSAQATYDKLLRLQPSPLLAGMAAAAMIRVHLVNKNFSRASKLAHDRLVPLLPKLKAAEVPGILIHAVDALAKNGEFDAALRVVEAYVQGGATMKYDLRQLVDQMKKYLVRRVEVQGKEEDGVLLDMATRLLAQDAETRKERSATERKLSVKGYSRKVLRMFGPEDRTHEARVRARKKAREAKEAQEVGKGRKGGDAVGDVASTDTASQDT